MKVITAIIAWGINKVIKGITVTALIAHWSFQKICPEGQIFWNVVVGGSRGSSFVVVRPWLRKSSQLVVIKGITVTALIARRINNLNKTNSMVNMHIMFEKNTIVRDRYSNRAENFKRPKNREDSFDLDENLTESIAATQTYIWKSFPHRTGSKNMFSSFFSRQLRSE